MPKSLQHPADRLADLWRQGKRPELREFLAHLGDLPDTEVVAVCRVDQQARWKIGERIPAESYIDILCERTACSKTSGAPARDSELELELVYAEYLLREELDDAPHLTEYKKRFPELSERLGRQLAFRRALESTDLTQAPTQCGSPMDAGPAFGRQGDYEFLCEVGRGGMGIVYRGRDAELGRDMAIKVLRDDLQDDPAARGRFIEEARIGGQLEHPGLVPVHELGELPDGRPYFTMKLIQGCTLADLLRERTDAGQDRSRFLQIFEQICQTVAYTHSRGVIHRDLKPSNVMVGAFGEVQVMDWGLAKILDHSPNGGHMLPETPAENDRVAPSTESPAPSRIVKADAHTTVSETGAVLGTLAYMAPEQMRGEVGRLDERCDVFALGAILYEILIGQPPFSQASFGARDDPGMTAAWHRLDQCGADGDLISLNKRCLAAVLEDRPRDAGEVAGELRAYLDSVEDRLRRTELARVEAQAKASEERKRRRLTIGLAAAVLALVLVVGAGAWWLDRKRATDVARAEAEIGLALREARNYQAEEKYAEALAIVRPLESRLPGSSVRAAMRQEVLDLRADLEFQAELEEIRVTGAEAGTGAHSKLYSRSRALSSYREALTRRGVDLNVAKPDEIAGRLQDSPIRAALVAAILDWAHLTVDVAEQERLVRILDMTDSEVGAWERALRAAWHHKDAAALRQLIATADATAMPRATLAQIGRTLRYAGAAADSVRWLQAAQLRAPADFWINCELAASYVSLQPPRWEEALRYASVAAALKPHTAANHHNVGTALSHLERYADAEPHYRRALALRPDYSEAHNNLGIALEEQGRRQEALPHYRESITTQPEVPEAYTNLGLCLNDLGQHSEAIGPLTKAAELRPGDATSHTNLGLALEACGRRAEAIAAGRKAIEVQPNQPQGYEFLGAILLKSGSIADAAPLMHKASELKRRAAK